MKIYKYKISDYSPAELNKLSALCDKNQKSKQPQSIIAHAELKKLLAAHYNIQASDIILKAGEHGKPFYKDDIKFSITHSGNYVFIALDDKEIGLDAELIREINIEILRKTATKEESEFLRHSNSFDIDFLKMWTVKEAYYKYTGTGIIAPADISAGDIQNKYDVITYEDCGYIISAVKEKTNDII